MNALSDELGTESVILNKIHSAICVPMKSEDTVSGVIYLGCILFAASRGRYSASNNSPVELVGLYWHFVDLIWILVFTFVYLL